MCLMSYVLTQIYGVVDYGKEKTGMTESGEDLRLYVMLLILYIIYMHA